jgi:hypothetical protein
MPPSRAAKDPPCRELAVRTLAATRGGNACLHHDGTCGILAGTMKATRHRRASAIHPREVSRPASSAPLRQARLRHSLSDPAQHHALQL